MTKEVNKFQELYEGTFKSVIKDEVASKNKFDYLSWAYATKHLKINYPEAKIQVVKYSDSNNEKVLPYLASPLGYFVTVRIFLTRQDAIDNIFEEFTHPVFDYRNQAIQKPTTMNINNSIQRATAKIIGIATGIGLSLYANEDIPNELNAPSDKSSPEPPFLKSGINASNEHKPKPSQKVKSVNEFDQATIDGAIGYLSGSQNLNQLELRKKSSIDKYPQLKDNPQFKKTESDTRLMLEAAASGL